MTSTGGTGQLRDDGAGILWSVGVSALAPFALIAFAVEADAPGAIAPVAFLASC
jgi:hypothetical protein